MTYTRTTTQPSLLARSRSTARAVRSRKSRSRLCAAKATARFDQYCRRTVRFCGPKPPPTFSRRMYHQLLDLARTKVECSAIKATASRLSTRGNFRIHCIDFKAHSQQPAHSLRQAVTALRELLVMSSLAFNVYHWAGSRHVEI